MAQDRPERLACRPQHAPDRHTHPTRSAFSRLASLQVIEFISLPRMSHASLDAQPSPVLSPVAPARRLPSLSTIDGRSPLGHIGPMRQVEQISRSTALLNPALAPSHPNIVVLLSATRVCLAGQARPRPSARSRSGGAGDLRDSRQRGTCRGPAHPVLALHTCSAAAPIWAVHGGSAGCLLRFCMHIHNF